MRDVRLRQNGLGLIWCDLKPTHQVTPLLHQIDPLIPARRPLERPAGRIPILVCRRRHRSNPERETCGLRSSRTTASRSSRDTRRVRRKAIATASWAGVSVVCNRWGVAAVIHRISVPPLADGLPCRPVSLGQNRSRPVTGLDRRPNHRRHCRLTVKMDQHGRSLRGNPIFRDGTFGLIRTIPCPEKLSPLYSASK